MRRHRGSDKQKTAEILARELRLHAPFTALGAVTGIVLMVFISLAGLPRAVSETLFWTLHPIHVLLSALVTTGMYRIHGNRGFWNTLAIGYVGSVGISMLSDCVIPYVGEILLGFPNREIHLSVIEKWWLVNPLALLGIALATVRPMTRYPHAGHVLLSTWASLFHMTMALGGHFGAVTVVLVTVFLFLAVWIPCCTSDIVLPLLFSKARIASSSKSIGTGGDATCTADAK